MHTAKALKQLLSSIDEGEFKYQKKEEERINWTSYDCAQINEISDMLRNIRDTVDYVCIELEIDSKPKSKGRPPVHPGDVTKAVLMQQYFSAANRVTEGLLRLFKEKLSISEFSYKTVERGYDRDDVKEILLRIYELVQGPISDKEHNFSIDGTGLSTSIKLNYEKEKKKRNMHTFEQVILTVGTQYKMIASAIITGNPYAAESPYLEISLENVLQIYSSVHMMTGDAAFLSRENTSAIASIGAIPRLYPKKNVTLRAKGHPAWKHMLYQFLDDAQKWLREYHQRSISKSVNSAFQRMFKKKLTRRARSRRRTEILVRICAFNIKRFCYLNHLEPHLFRSQNRVN